jgi:hypothetical protein
MRIDMTGIFSRFDMLIQNLQWTPISDYSSEIPLGPPIWETVRLFSTFAFAVGPTEAYYDVQSSYHR